MNINKEAETMKLDGVNTALILQHMKSDILSSTFQ